MQGVMYEPELTEQPNTIQIGGRVKRWQIALKGKGLLGAEGTAQQAAVGQERHQHC